MTQQKENTGVEAILKIINEYGMDGLKEAVSILINEAMKVERSHVLNALPWERSEDRTGYANGFKDKQVASRFGNLSLKIPQVRGDVSFYPSALDKGLRSERALKVAMACMSRAFLPGKSQQYWKKCVGLKSAVPRLAMLLSCWIKNFEIMKNAIKTVDLFGNTVLGKIERALCWELII